MPASSARGGDVLDEPWRNVNSINPSAGAGFMSKERREESCARADIGDRFACFHADSPHD